MEAEKSKVETLFGDVEQRLAATSKLTVAERKKELQAMDPVILALGREFERFQMIGYNKYAAEIDEMEERYSKIKTTVQRALDEDLTVSAVQGGQEINESDVVEDAYDPTKQLVEQTNAKLAEGKARALNMLRMANSMRDELNMIDDEVMLQREKLVSINAQIKHAQSVTNQTKKIVNYFTKAVNDDKIVRWLIVIVAVCLLVIIGMGVSIKFKKGKLLEQKAEVEKVKQEKADYSQIDEGYFYKVKEGMSSGQKLSDVMRKAEKYKKEKDAKKKTSEVAQKDSLDATPKPDVSEQPATSVTEVKEATDGNGDKPPVENEQPPNTASEPPTDGIAVNQTPTENPPEQQPDKVEQVAVEPPKDSEEQPQVEGQAEVDTKSQLR